MKRLFLTVLFIFAFTLSSCFSTPDSPEAEFIPLFDDVYLILEENLGSMTYEQALEFLNDLEYGVYNDSELSTIVLKQPYNYFLLYLLFDGDILCTISYTDNYFETIAVYNAQTGEKNYKNYDHLRDFTQQGFTDVNTQSDFIKNYVNEKLREYKESTAQNEMINAEIDAHYISDGEESVIRIESNLPEGTVFDFILESENYRWPSQVRIKDAVALTGRFEPPEPGEYKIKVYLSAPSVQSEQVRKIIGNYGEFLTGELTADADIYSSAVRLEAIFDFTV